MACLCVSIVTQCRRRGEILSAPTIDALQNGAVNYTVAKQPAVTQEEAGREQPRVIGQPEKEAKLRRLVFRGRVNSKRQRLQNVSSHVGHVCFCSLCVPRIRQLLRSQLTKTIRD